MTTYLVTGAAGFIGSHTAEALLARGDAVRGLDSFDPYYDPAVKRRNAALIGAAGATLVEGDLRDPDAVARALEGADAVIHFAARPGVRASLDDPRTTFDVNVMGTLSLLQAIRARGAAPPPLVFASSSSVYGGDARPPFVEDAPASRPLSPYAASKRAAEHLVASYCELFGLRAIGLRFFTVYGPRGRPDMAIGNFVRRALAGASIPLLGDGSVVRDFTYVDDIVAGVLAAADRLAASGGVERPAFEVINLGGGNTATVADLLRIIEEACGCPLRIERRPAADGDMPLTQADLTRASERLGFEARVPLTEGVRRTVAWMKRELASAAGARL